MSEFVPRVWIVVKYDYDEHSILSVCATKEVGLASLEFWIAKDDADKQESQRFLDRERPQSTIRWWPLEKNAREVEFDEVRQVREPGPTYALQPWALVGAAPDRGTP